MLHGKVWVLLERRAKGFPRAFLVKPYSREEVFTAWLATDPRFCNAEVQIFP